MHQYADRIIPKTQGVTLVELLICLAVIAILAGYAAPMFNDIIQRNQAATAINWAIGSVNFARHSAVTLNTTVTLCPSRTGNACGGQWHEGAIAFSDSDVDRVIDDKDVLLRRFDFPVKGATLKWRAFQNRQYLQLTSRGYTNWQNGNFLYCPPDRNPQYARGLIINMPGRARLAPDINHDGIVEDSRGRAVDCGN